MSDYSAMKGWGSCTDAKAAFSLLAFCGLVLTVLIKYLTELSLLYDQSLKASDLPIVLLKSPPTPPTPINVSRWTSVDNVTVLHRLSDGNDSERSASNCNSGALRIILKSLRECYWFVIAVRNTGMINVLPVTSQRQLKYISLERH